MTKQEAIERIKARFDKLALDDKDIKAIQTLIPELHESEDEKIIRAIINALYSHTNSINLLSSRGYQMEDIEAWLEKQKDISKAIEAVERIDNYITEHTANSWEMDDSNPDKKYYCGVDDTLANIAWILQDVYLGEKEKEQTEELSIRLNGLMQEYVKSGKDEEDQEHRLKCYQLFWDALGDSEFFKQKEQKPILEVFGFKVGDAVRLKDGDGRKHIIKSFEEVEGVHGPNFYHVKFEDNSASDGIYPGEEYPNGYYTQMEKFEEEQKPAEYADDVIEEAEEYTSKVDCGDYSVEVTEAYIAGVLSERNRGTEWSENDEAQLDDIEEAISNYYDLNHAPQYQYWLEQKLKSLRLQPKQEWNEVELEFRGEKVKVKRPFFRNDKGREYSTTKQDEDVAWYALRAWCEKKGVSLYDLYPKEEWSEEDINNLNRIATILVEASYVQNWWSKGRLISKDEMEKLTDWLKSLRSKTNKKIYEVAKHELAIRFMSYLDDNRLEGKMCLSNSECEDIDKAFKEIDWKKIMQYVKKYLPHWKPRDKKYDGNMDKECIKLCDIFNSIPSIDTFESCCGHLKDRYSIWFFCNDIITISRLGRCVERNYSDGKWELLVDSIDTHPTGVFWLRSKVPFQSYDEMEKSVNELCNNIQHWFNTKFDSHFNDDVVKQEFY